MALDETTLKWSVGSAVSAIVAWVSFAKYRADRAKAQEDREDKLELERNTASDRASNTYDALVNRLIAERDSLTKRLDTQDAKIEKLQATIEELRDSWERDKRRIEQLEGELRQANQVLASRRSLDHAARESDTKPKERNDG